MQFMVMHSVNNYISAAHNDYSYSVLVHSGGVHGGHYYAFIRPTLSDQWYACFILETSCTYFFDH